MAQLLLPPIAESLLLQFRSLAKARVEAAAPHVRPRPAAGRPGGGDHAQSAIGPAVTPARAPQDRGEAAVDAAAGALYERVLDGLRLVARHAATGLLDALLQWRKENLNLAARSGAELLILRKRVCAAPGPPRPPAAPARRGRVCSLTAPRRSWRWRPCSWRPAAAWSGAAAAACPSGRPTRWSAWPSTGS